MSHLLIAGNVVAQLEVARVNCRNALNPLEYGRGNWGDVVANIDITLANYWKSGGSFRSHKGVIAEMQWLI